MITSRIDELFRLFLKAAGFELKGADFKTRQKKYSNSKIRLPESSVTEEEIRKSQGFAGFVEGAQGKHHKFKGPMGTPDTTESGNSDFEKFYRRIISRTHDKETTERTMQGIGEVAEKLGLAGDYLTSYDKGYNLGLTYSSIFQTQFPPQR